MYQQSLGHARRLCGGDEDEPAGAMLVAHFLKRWESDDTLMALLRAAVTNEAAAERAREIFATQVAPAVRTVAPDPDEAAVWSGRTVDQLTDLPGRHSALPALFP